jgi:hypothetical protein
MSLRELPVGRQHAWLLDGAAEDKSRAPGTPVRWSGRRAFLWGAACLGGVTVFIASAFLCLMMMAPEANSYLG